MVLHSNHQISAKKYARLALIIVCLGVILRSCFLRPTLGFQGAYFNRGTNATWLGVEWVDESHSVEEITALTDTLSQRQIRDIFVYVSYLRPNGEFGLTYSHANGFVQTIKAIHPGLIVQAWVGLPLEYVDLSDIEVRERIATFCADLVQNAGFDGIHLDPEPVVSDDSNVLTLLDEVRYALGSEAVLSVATRRIWPILPSLPWPFVGHFAWHANYYREVAERVDQIAVMTYDSAMPLALLYRHWTRFQVIEISQAVDGIDVQLFVGIPTSEKRTWTHRPEAENMTSGLQGAIDGLNDLEAHPANVTGVAIYPYWHTSETEWSIYESLWLSEGD